MCWVFLGGVRKSFNLSRETNHITSLGTSAVSFITLNGTRACFLSGLGLTGFSMCLRVKAEKYFSHRNAAERITTTGVWVAPKASACPL